MPVNPSDIRVVTSQEELDTLKPYVVRDPECIKTVFDDPKVEKGDFALALCPGPDTTTPVLLVVCMRESCQLCKPSSRGTTAVFGNTWACFRSRHSKGVTTTATEGPTPKRRRVAVKEPVVEDSASSGQSDSEATVSETTQNEQTDAPVIAALRKEVSSLKAEVGAVNTKLEGYIASYNALSARLTSVELEQRENYKLFRQRLANGAGPTAKSTVTAPCADGSCVVCKSQKGVNMQLNLLGLEEFNKKGNSIRNRPAPSVYKILRKNLICRSPMCVQDKGLLMDYKNQHGYCMICRIQRSSHITCSNCNGHITLMERDHAKNKIPFKTAIDVLANTVHDVLKVECIPEFNPWVVTGKVNDPDTPKDVATNGSADTVVVLDTKDNKRLLFVIEFQNSKREDPDMLTHKFGYCIEIYKPYKAFLWCASISQGKSRLSLAERIDVMRRWMIAIVLNVNKMPGWSHWWFFQIDNDKPITQNGVTTFLSSPIKVDFAPKGDTSDWQYASDPLAGHKPICMRGKRAGQLKKIQEEAAAMEVDDDENAEEGAPNAAEAPADQPRLPALGEVFSYLAHNQKPIGTALSGNWPVTCTVTDYSGLNDPERYMYCAPDCTLCKRFFPAKPS